MDHHDGVILDPTAPPIFNYQALRVNYYGLHQLASTVREHELQYIANDAYAHKVSLHMSGNVHPIVSNAFNWYTMTISNYLRLVGFIQLMNQEGWNQDELRDKAKRKKISTHCSEYVAEAIPEISVWRNKVSAHFALTDPRQSDNVGTLLFSVMELSTYKYPYYKVGGMQYAVGEEVSDLPEWSVTENFEALSDRFWPELGLKPIPVPPPD